MQLSYQFPERCERLVLVDSGGLGRDVSLLLRAATLPGSELVLPLLVGEPPARRRPPRRQPAGPPRPARRHRHRGDRPRPRHALRPRGPRAPSCTRLRSVVEPGGQRVDASNRLYLAEHLPLLLLWGEHDSLIPVCHGRAAHEQRPGSRLEVFADSGHFPQLDEPERFLDVLVDFIDSTEPAVMNADGWRELLKAG